jgi:hypothetical protein
MRVAGVEQIIQSQVLLTNCQQHYAARHVNCVVACAWGNDVSGTGSSMAFSEYAAWSSGAQRQNMWLDVQNGNALMTSMIMLGVLTECLCMLVAGSALLLLLAAVHCVPHCGWVCESLRETSAPGLWMRSLVQWLTLWSLVHIG